MSQRLEEIATRADAILANGERKEVTCLLALVAGLTAVAKVRLLELREPAVPPARDRHLTVKAASAAYPVSRSFLYEHGADAGIVTRPSRRKVIVDVEALERWLGGRR